MQLIELSIGERGRIVDLSKCQLLIQKRLYHLGVYENCEVLLQNMLPFGGPCMISCGEQCISLRKNEARLIEVEKMPCR